MMNHHDPAISDRVPALISFFDTNFVCRYANGFHRAWYGREPASQIGRSVEELFGPDVAAKRMEHWSRLAAGEQVTFLADIRHSDGTLHSASVRYVPHLQGGKMKGFYAFVFDMDDQQYMFESMFGASAVGYWELDFRGVKKALEAIAASGWHDPIQHLYDNPRFMRQVVDNIPVLNMNKKARQLFGVAEEDMPGLSLGRFVPPGTEKVVAANIVAYLKGESNFENETVLCTLDGDPVEVLISASFPRKDGFCNTLTLGTVDISYRNAQDRRLSQLEAELAHSSRVSTLGQLTASIAHEVNQPLGAVMTNGNAALRWLNRDVPDLEEAQAALRRLISEAERAAEIIQRTRSLAKKGEPNRIECCLGQLLADVEKLVHRETTSMGCELRVEELPCEVRLTADPIQIQQVLINLIVNAAQAMREQPGRRLIRLSASTHGEIVKLQVRDNGPGFGPSSSDFLFDPFYTTKGDGMGIGLSVARTIVEAHGGSISASLGGTRGSVFEFTLPCMIVI
ncbi:PAS domain S-box-containing protein [Rhizobium leguminosarum]|uniref:histidine kinase n=2 Tax=Rhizobium leguminosarum TaxID=384 RepID=A0AAE2ML59_RHILE|nr:MULTISPECIES: ATP-binding protein [Rhizobium]MBB4291511.1 PAS domain S-box-containing protein [Rhizobium leguminosarum]MBB4296208.1 PAS domain S-box-containing protein [Rhizobium leguminosarum]MBB4308533.1 PAS domain S-box-containing protein [Rhizobium leguminosarum]MBB4530408.1 PAS domain S-box-containing protein [Rhizobium leguminosarum]MBB4540719.1 PAS domain S-box-containing protein [Rhizobium leguminosarum]